MGGGREPSQKDFPEQRQKTHSVFAAHVEPTGNDSYGNQAKIFWNQTERIVPIRPDTAERAVRMLDGALPMPWV